MRAEGTWLSRVVTSVDGGLLARSPALVDYLNDDCVFWCWHCACVELVGGAGYGERLRELCPSCCLFYYCPNIVSVYKVITYLTRLETRIAEFSVCASH